MLSYSRQGCRWILEHTNILAYSLDFKPKAFTKHCAVLEKEYKLIERHRMRDISPFDRSNRMAILLCDVPEKFPGHITEEQLTEALGEDAEDTFEDGVYDSDLSPEDEGDLGELWDELDDEEDIEEPIVAPPVKGRWRGRDR